MDGMTSANNFCGDDFHFEERFYSARSHFYSTEVLSSNSDLPSSSTFSMDVINFDSFECDDNGFKDGSSENEAEDEDIFNFKDENNETIDTYPSGRKPLIPLQVDTGNSEHQRNKKKIVAHDDHEGDDLDESLSWLSRTLCVVPTDSTCDSLSQVDNERVCTDEISVILNVHKENQVENNVKSSREHYLDEYPPKANETTKLDDITKDKIENESSMDNFFQAKSLFCDTWETWYDTIESNDLAGESSNTSTRFALNRSKNLNARKKKIEYLRRNLAPFDVDQMELKVGSINTEKYSPCEHGSIHFSFSNSKPSNLSKSQSKQNETKNSMNATKCTPTIARGCGDYRNIGEIPIVPSEDDLKSISSHDDELCYDSDPSDLMPTTQSPSRRLQSRQNRRARSIYDMNGNLDDFLCLEKICEHMNSKRVLIWHRQCTDEKTIHPIAVHAWIEQGSQLVTTLIQPKFCWRKTYEKEPHDRSILTIHRFNAVDLLDMSKIVAVSKSTYRGKYPFMQRKNSFVIEAFDQEFLFEARDEIERDDIVVGLKLLVARLGSKIMIGDSRVLDEFFSPLGASVPGRIPKVVTDYLQA